jgi:aminoglycoside phosphotransferase family enzyme/predicted kinase
VLFFVGDRVYKLKKPVALGFLDFSSRAQREAACRREVELNRRLAPDVYLGVADISGPDGELCDHLVVMRRLPDERRLATLVRRGARVEHALRALAHVVAAFHASADTSDVIADAGTRDAVLRNWDDNFEQMRPFVGPVLDVADSARVEALAHRYLQGRATLFADRIAAGRVVDGHGDLQAEDVFCMEDGPRVLDCIEFDDRLRYGDVLADVAFLAMDLERLGAAEQARRFLVFYRELSGETHPESLAHHYIAYRAHVRSKVACMRHAQGDAEAASEAARLLSLARRHLEFGRVALVLVGGLPGTGKSTLAAGLADTNGWVLLRSDEVRKDLSGRGHDATDAVPYGQGIYRREVTEATYRELLHRARSALSRGHAVVLDASWTDRREREAARRMAEETATDLVELRCMAPSSVATARITRRAREGRDVSDATPEIAAAMAVTADEWPSAVDIDTSGTEARSLERAREALGTALT